MIYLFIGIIFIVLAYIEAIGRDQQFSHISLTSLLFVLLLFAGLRHNVGTDWYAYLDFYQDTSETERVEPGYSILNNTFSRLSIPYNVFLIFVNGISLWLMYVFFKTNAKLPIIGMLLFFSDLFLYFNLSGIRQAVAISITSYSINYALKNQFVRFALLVFIASSFHLSACFFLIAYFISRERLNIRYLLFVIVVIYVGYFYFQSISDFFTTYTLKNALYYIEYQEKAVNISESFYLGIAKRLVLIAVILVYSRKIFQDSNTFYFINIYVAGLIIYICTYMVSPDIGVRLSSYFTIFDVLIAGNLIYFTQKTMNRIVIVTIFSSIAIYKLLGFIESEYYMYHSVLLN